MGVANVGCLWVLKGLVVDVLRTCWKGLEGRRDQRFVAVRCIV